MKAFEINFDGLVGPTHNYAGLSYGNVASTKNRAGESNPKEAALQGLKKMRLVADLGLKQAVLPPHERPDVAALRSLGFSGGDAEVLASAGKSHPHLLAACSSSSAMWTANAATVTPSADALDGKVHFTPANLVFNFHRTLEPPTTSRILRAIFSDEAVFEIHPPLPASLGFGDEGAANHTRFCTAYASTGVELFVFGRHAFDDAAPRPKKFPARQTFEASEALARRHKVRHAVFAQQNPDAIDAGVFHNDVVAVGNQNALFYHELAFHKSASVIAELKHAFNKTCGGELVTIEVPGNRVPLKDAVDSYLFNTQLLTLGDGTMTLIAPIECQGTPSVKAYLDELTARSDHPIRSVNFVDVRQSMKNGGGPACLRLRAALTEREIVKTNPSVFLDDVLYQKLAAWIEKHYRDRLTPEDLQDPKLLQEVRSALDELTHILKLGSVYPFQL